MGDLFDFPGDFFFFWWGRKMIRQLKNVPARIDTRWETGRRREWGRGVEVEVGVEGGMMSGRN